MNVIMYLFLFFVVFFMTIFTFTAEKQINLVRCGISAFVLNIVFTVGWVSEVAGLIWHEGMDFFHALRRPGYSDFTDIRRPLHRWDAARRRKAA